MTLDDEYRDIIGPSEIPSEIPSKPKRVRKRVRKGDYVSKAKRKELAKRGKFTRTCRCTRCGAFSERSRYALHGRANGIRCEACGGNVVEKRFA